MDAMNLSHISLQHQVRFLTVAMGNSPRFLGGERVARERGLIGRGWVSKIGSHPIWPTRRQSDKFSRARVLNSAKLANRGRIATVAVKRPCSKEEQSLESTSIMVKQSKTTKEQTFRFTAPDARSVLLVGDFTQWQKQAIPLRKDKKGVWTTSVELAPGKHIYRFIVDGEWRDDPECTLRVPNPFGGQDMVRQAA
jgi:hypothetical protein